MVDEHIKEPDIIPYYVSLPYGERVLVLAPHPDDETFGCGGTLRILSNAGKTIKVVFLTKGEKSDPEIKDTEKYTAVREKEAERALRVLGVSDYEFLRFPDRGLFENYKDASEKLMKITAGYMPDAVYSPSKVELNPDHRAAAGMTLELQKKHNFRAVFYEVVTPIRPNILIDITKVIKIKWKAVRSYKSQLKIYDYLDINRSLNRIRSLTLDKKVLYAEAFLVIDKASEQAVLDKWFNYEIPLDF